MDWVLLSLGVSILTALYIHTNHFFQLDGVQLVHLRAVLVLLLVLVLLPWVGPLPHNVALYGLAAIVGVLTTFADRGLLNAAAKYGGRLTSLFISLKIAVVFVLWSAWSPESFMPLLAKPVQFAGLAACYGLMVIALLKMRRNDASLAALIAIAPAAVLLGVCDVLSKEALEGGPLWSNMLIFMGAVSVVQWLTSGVLLWRRQTLWRQTYCMAYVPATVVIGGVFILMVGMFLWGVVLSPNPAYVSAISVLSTAWLTLYYKCTRGDDASTLASLVLVAAAILLTLITA